ncbi:MAG: NAD-dependent dehydratase, partial [Chitinophagaceae bacterium]
IIQLLSGSTEIKLGDLSPTRDLVYVADTVAGFIEIAKSEKLTGHDVNIATGTEISIGDLAQKIIDQINPEAKIVQDKARLRPEKSEVFRLVGDNRKITETTGWKPQFSLDDSLTQTIAWFRKDENLKQYKAGIYNI